MAHRRAEGNLGPVATVGGPRALRADYSQRSVPKPGHWLCRLCQPGFFQYWVVSPFAETDRDLFTRDLDDSLRVDELSEQSGRSGTSKAL